MKLFRREFLRLTAGALAVPACARIAGAQPYPSKPVRLVVGFPAGGTGDILARLVGQWLQARLGQAFVIENRPGAGSNIATEAVVKAAADGYTLGWTSPSNAISATLYDNLNFNFIRDIAPVAGVTSGPLVLVTNPSLPATTVPDLLAYAKANPGKLNMASNGNGTSSHLAGELFKMMTGVNIVHVPYRGGAPALTDLIGGQVQMMFDLAPSSIEFIRAGKLRPLAVTTAMRSEILPEIPTVGDFVPGYEVSAWHGVGAPRGTPNEIIETLNNTINAALTDPASKARLAALGGVALTGSPGDFGKLVADETEKWAKVVKFSGAKPA